MQYVVGILEYKHNTWDLISDNYFYLILILFF